ncbi:hypothetical protein G4O51_12005 [Candidatus Bathyarchaeota archaeon A05DMB-2]|nr:hypothetical protein [Candidatus Bathyarchaeota archaeon A05DMB-2]
MRIPVLQRERATILYLRRHFGYSTNVLAEAFGRSRSLIHRILKFNKLLGTLPWRDYRQLPDRVKKIGNARQQRQLAFFMEKWQAFILGEGEKPP